MIINCAHCHADLYVNDSKVPQRGVKGRCSKCQHVFLIEPSPSGDKPDPAKDAQKRSSSLGDLPAWSQSPATEAEPQIDVPSEGMVFRQQKLRACQRSPIPIPKSLEQFDKGTAGVAIAFIVLVSFLHLTKMATILGTVLLFVSFGVYLFFSYLSSGQIRIGSYKDVLFYLAGLFAGILIKVIASM
jgi:predicted Zn finger-like uncharacterized protein